MAKINQISKNNDLIIDSLQKDIFCQHDRLIELRCVTEHHYKVYFIHQKRVNHNCYMVTAYWGRIDGKKFSSQIKYQGPSKLVAERKTEELSRRKQRYHNGTAYTVHTDISGNTIVDMSSSRWTSLEVCLESLEKISSGKNASIKTENGETRFTFLEV